MRSKHWGYHCTVSGLILLPSLEAVFRDAKEVADVNRHIIALQEPECSFLEVIANVLVPHAK